MKLLPSTFENSREQLERVKTSPVAFANYRDTKAHLSKSPTHKLTISSKQSQFDPAHYMVIYEELMESPEGRQAFHSYLKESHNEEPILFLDQLAKIKKEHRDMQNLLNSCLGDSQEDIIEGFCVSGLVMNMFERIQMLIETYVHRESLKELNLGETQGATLKRWEKVVEGVRLFASNEPTLSFEKSRSSSSLNGSKISFSESNDMDLNDQSLHIFYLMDPNTLFEQVELTVNLDLKIDQFPRFVRSEQLLNFLGEKGEEFTRRIAVNISKGFNVDIRYKPKDFTSSVITDRDIFFGFSLYDDTVDWEMFLQEETYHLYHSKTSYVIGQDRMEGMSLLKSIHYLPFDVKDVWSVFCDKESRIAIEKNIYNDELQLVKYISPCQSQHKNEVLGVDTRDDIIDPDKPPLSQQWANIGIDLKIPMLKKRELRIASTSIYEPSLGCYMLVARSTKFDHIPERKDMVEIQTIFYYMFFKVNAKLTRFVTIAYNDLFLPFNSEYLMKLFWRKRAKIVSDGFQNVLQTRTCIGMKHVDPTEINDVLQCNRAIKDNANISWAFLV